MAKLETKRTGRPKAGMQTAESQGLPFTRKNYLIFVAGLVVIVIGYFALAQGSITLAPILLVLGYCVILPVGILYRGTETPATDQGAIES